MRWMSVKPYLIIYWSIVFNNNYWYFINYTNLFIMQQPKVQGLQLSLAYIMIRQCAHQNICAVTIAKKYVHANRQKINIVICWFWLIILVHSKVIRTWLNFTLTRWLRNQEISSISIANVSKMLSTSYNNVIKSNC